MGRIEVAKGVGPRPRRAPPTARTVAADVVVRVLRDSAFAAAVLDVELDENIQLDARDRALATELTYGTLRLRGWLEARVSRYASRGARSIEIHVLSHLLVASYQLLVLTRVPDFAVVSETVSAIRGLRGDRVGGFANAVLRKIAKEPKPSPHELAHAALDGADPDLARALVASVGEEGALALVASDRAPPLGLRVEDPGARATWIAALREARPDAEIEEGRLSPLAINVRGAGRLADLPGLDEGGWTAQEEGSQLVALALGAGPGDLVLDACAGRGHKTSLLARAVRSDAARSDMADGGRGGAVDAADLHAKKLVRLADDMARLGLEARRTFAVDWSVGIGEVTGPYDRVLVDAPCSGTGTLRRRPELLLRRAGGDLAALAALQRTILGRAASLVRPGGRVVYAVCSVLREEAEDVVAAAEGFGLVSAPFDADLVGRLAGGATSLRLLPHVHGTDGYFIASFRRPGP